MISVWVLASKLSLIMNNESIRFLLYRCNSNKIVAYNQHFIKKMSPVRNNLYTEGLMLPDFIMLSGISLSGMNAYQ